MSEEQGINLDSRKLFELAANILAGGFLKKDQVAAKQLFKDVKQGKNIIAAHLTSDTGTKIPVKLELDRSAYIGQFNYPNFMLCLNALLQRCQVLARKDPQLQNLRTRPNEATGGILFNIAGPGQVDEHVNLLMMAVEPENNGLTLRLMFIDTDQFEQNEAES